MKRLVVFIVSLLMILLGVGTAQGLTPGEWRGREVQGVGLGYIEAHYGDGLKLFYDLTPVRFLQFHFNVYQATIRRFPETRDETLETSSTGGAVSARLFPLSGSGLFGGWGRGRSRVNQKVPGALHGRGTAEPVVSTARYSYTFLELGWQGWEGFYFAANLQRGRVTVLDEDDRTGSIADSEVRELSREAFGEAGHILALHLGFGWHL